MSLIEEALKRQARDGLPAAPPVVRPLDPPPPAPAPPAPPVRRRPPRRATARPSELLPGAALLAGVILLLLPAMVVVWREWQRRTPLAAPPPVAIAAVPPASAGPALTNGAATDQAAMAAVTNESPEPSSAPMASAAVEPAAGAPLPLAPTGEVAVLTAPAIVLSHPAPTNPPPAETPWPLFTVKGFAVGENSLAMLSNGEMLGEGELSKTGARLLCVTPEGVWFEWRGQTNMLRKGESSDKPIDVGDRR
jgi:hypothetical protein